MVAVFTGLGLGTEHGSGFVLGSRGQLGSAGFGRLGENVYVNAANGNLALQRSDQILTSIGADLNIGMSYNSQGTMSDDNGDNWALAITRQVTGLTGTVNTAGSTVNRIDWDGSTNTYSWDATRNAYVSMQGSGAYDTLTYATASSTWTWKDGDTGSTDTYSTTGYIAWTKDNNGKLTTFTVYNGLIKSIVFQDGSKATLTYSGTNLSQIAYFDASISLSTPALTTVRYGYDASNRLTSVTTDLTPTDNSIADGKALTTTYTYDGTSRRVASISQAGGARLDITYVLVGSTYRVDTLTQAQASGASSLTSFSYDIVNLVTTVTDAQGQQTRLSYDAQGQLVRLEQPAATTGAAAQVSTFAYNANGDVTSATDPAGNVTSYNYDANGNLAFKQDAAGNSAAYTYSSTNLLLTETHYLTPDPDGAGAGTYGNPVTTRYAYDSKGNLTYVVTQEGRVTQYVYSLTGLLQSTVVVNAGSGGPNLYNTTGLAPSTAITSATLDSWMRAISDKSSFLVTDTTYDFRGNVSTVTTYAQTTTAGAGVLTGDYTRVTYVYDQAGNLLSRHDNRPGAATETYLYDGLNRLIGSTDLAGAATSIVFTDATNTQVVTAANGATVTNVYDLAGELISSTTAGNGVAAATTSYAYDSLGQLRMTTNALTQKSYFLYDHVGRKVADISADGAVSEFVYDADDRVAHIVQYITKLSAGQLASLVDGQGKPANVDFATLRPSANAGDRWDWSIYDAAGRLIETIGSTGSVTTFSYDGASEPVASTRYYNALSVSGFKTTPPTALQLPAADARDVTTRSFYDRDGKLIGTLDPTGALTQITYDTAGLKLRVVAFANLTTSSLRASGTFAQLLASVGTTTRDNRTDYVYDDEGRLAFTLDANARPTGFSYDASGNLVQTVDYAGPIASAPSYTLAYVQNQLSSTGLATDARNRTSHTVYDGAGRIAFAINATGMVTSFGYDAVGNVIKKTVFVATDPGSGDYSLATWQSWASAHADAAKDHITYRLYDGLGRQVYIAEAATCVTETQYDALGRVAKTIRHQQYYTVTDSSTVASLAAQIASVPEDPSITSYSYDSAGRLTDMVDPTLCTTHYVYDALDQLVDEMVAYGSATDASTTHRTYDAAGRPQSVTLAAGTAIAATTTYAYDALGNVWTVTDARNNVTTNSYDTLGRLISVTDPLNAVTSYQYDAFGNRVKTTDARGNSSFSYYNDLDQLELQVDAEGYATATSYSIGGGVSAITHYATRVSGSYDTITRPTIATAAKDQLTSFTRDKLDRVTDVTDAEGFAEHYTLDAFGNRIQVINKLGGITNNQFDALNQLVAETRVENTYDALGNPWASYVTTSYCYDVRGNRTQMKEAAGLPEERVTNYWYDKLNRLVWKQNPAFTVRSADGSSAVVRGEETYAYDLRGNLIEHKDAAGARTLGYYDAAGNKTAELNAVGRLIAYGYDRNGNVSSTTIYGDAVALPSVAGGTAPAPINGGNFRKTEYEYDKDNRLINTINRNVAVGQQVGSVYNMTTSDVVQSATYDAVGNVIVQTDGRTNQLFLFYDKAGHKIGQVDQENYLTTYDVDADGNVKTETRYATRYAGVMSQGADLNAVKNAVGSNAQDRITQFEYDRNGRRISETRLNLVASSVNTTTGALTTATVNATIGYSYNALGLVTRKTEANGDYTDYTFDLMGRMTEIQKAAYLDHNGNSVRPTTDMQYDGNDELVRQLVRGTDGSSETDDRITQYEYEGGHVVWMKDPTGFVTWSSYDIAGRLLLQSYDRKKADGSTVTEGDFYSYDLVGHQLSQTKGVVVNNVWTFGQSTDMRYDAYGEMVARGINTGGDSSKYQEFADYNSMGRVERTNFGDGVTKAYIYDANGNASMLLQATSNADLRSMTLDQMRGNGSGVTQTISVFDKRNQLTETIQPSIENAANLPDAINSFTTSTPGVNYSGGTPSIVAATSATDPGTAASATASMVASAAGSAVGDVQQVFYSGAQVVSYVVRVTVSAAPIYGTGDIHLCNSDGSIIPGTTAISVPANNTQVFHSVSGSNYQTYYLYQDIPGKAYKVLIGRVNQVSPSNQHVTGTIDKTVQIRNVPGGSLVMFVRPGGSSGAYQPVTVSHVPNSTGGSISDWYRIETASPPFNGMTTAASWDVKYFSVTGGAIVDSRAATLTIDASGNPSMSGDHGVGIGGTGKAMLVNDNGTQKLFLSEPVAGTSSIAVGWRTAGSAAAPTSVTAISAYGGFAAVDVSGWNGSYEVFVEDVGSPQDLKTKFIFTTGSQPASPASYTDAYVKLAQPAGTTSVTLYYRKGANPYASVNLTYNSQQGSWIWTPDATTAADASTYDFYYQSFGSVSQLTNAAHGQIKFGGSPSVLSCTADYADSQMVFSPPQSGATKLKLSYRYAGSTGSYSPVTLTKSGGVFSWDVEGLRPGSGASTYEFFYDLYDASNNLLPPAGGQQHATGYLTINASRTTTVQQLQWVVTLPLDPAAIIDRKQGYNAFGEIASETDGLGHTTTLSYNVIGKLITKQDPQVDDTSEFGVTTRVNPTTYYYYDLAGRMVGVEDTYHNRNTLVLLAGTGEDGNDAITTDEFHADGGHRQYRADIFGDTRTVTDELGAVTRNSYDAVGRLTQVVHPTRVGGNSNGVFLTDNYGYDGLGERITHGQMFGAQTQSETTDYDLLGRVTRTVDLAGNATSYSYTWSGALTNAGMMTVGGWVRTTNNAAGKQSAETDDYFGRIVAKTDFGSHTFSYAYNKAGDLTQQSGSTGQNVSYAYYGNGYIRSITDYGVKVVSTFEYDKEGNRTREAYQTTDSGTAQVNYQSAVITYDELNRMIKFADPKASITYKYDANNNRREVKSVYNDGIGGNLQTQDYWYAYDSMNRFTVTMGQLSGGHVVKGATGVLIAYNQANERVSAANADGTTEYYTYTADGYLEDTNITDAQHTTAVLRARRVNDWLGRVTTYTEYNWDHSVNFTQASNYDGENRVVSQTQQQLSGSTYITTTIQNDYKADVGGGIYTGADQGVLVHSRQQQGATTQDTRYTYQWWDEAKQTLIQVSANGGAYSNAQGASQLAYDVNGHLALATLTGGTTGTIVYTNDAYGQVLIREQKTLGGTIGPRQLYYYFNGNRIGDVGNNGPSHVDYATALSQRGVTKSFGEFRYGKPVASADFDENYQPIGPNYPGAAGSQYTVRSGDTLASIAQAVWGDSSMWYLIADANGLTDGDALVAGQILIIPNKVTNIHNRAGVYRVYDPGEAIGDLMPTLPAQPVPPTHHHGGCGVMGQILLVAVAVAVTVVTAGAAVAALAPASAGITGIGSALGALAAGAGATGLSAGALVGIGAAAGAAGSIVSQGVGVATGLQDNFSFKNVALAAIAGGIGAGLDAVPGLNGVKGLAGFGQDFARGALANGLTQGVALATGLQSQFDWGGIAAGGVVAGVGGALPSASGSWIQRATESGLSGSAAAVAGAAARSLLTGTDFGDNVMRALPDAIGNTIGNLAADELSRVGSPKLGYDLDALKGAGSGQVEGSPSSGNAQPGDIVVTARRHLITDAEIASYAARGQADEEANRAAANSSDDGWMRQVEIREPHDLSQLAVMRQEYDAAVKANPGAANDPDVYANFDYWEKKLAVQDAAGSAVANAEVNKFLFASIGAPALLAGGAVLAPAAGTYVAGLGVSGTTGALAYYGTSFLVGGAGGGAFEYSKNRVFGLQDTRGGYIGSFLGGGVGATGWQILGRGAPVLLNNIALGGVAGGGGDAIGQYADLKFGNRTSFDGRSILVSTAIGAAAGSASSLEVRVGGLNAGRNSSLSLYNGLQTRIRGGNLGQFQLRYGVMGGVGQGVTGIGQGAASSVYVGIYQDANR